MMLPSDPADPSRRYPLAGSGPLAPQPPPSFAATGDPTDYPEWTVDGGVASARPLGAAFWLVPALMLLAVAADVVLLQLGPEGPRPLVSEGGQLAGYIVAVICCALAFARSPRGRIRQAWGWMALAFASSMIAEGIFGYLVTFQHRENPFPSLADPFYLLFYPLMAIAVTRLPAAPTGGLRRLTLGLDTLIVAGSLLSGSWFFLLGPTFLQGADAPSTLVLSLAYPVGDLIITMALVVLALRGFDRAYRPVYLCLAAGMVVTVYADSAYTYLNLQNTYATGLAWVDPFWPAGALLMAVAPLYQWVRFDRFSFARGRLRTHEDERLAGQLPTRSFVHIVLPYIPTALLFFLVWLALTASADPRLLSVLELLALLVIALIIIRQVLTLRENAQLAQRQAGALSALGLANRRSAEYAHQLEEGIKHLNAVQVRIARGDLGARVPVLRDGLLFPVASMLNLMLDRLQGRMQTAQQNEQLGQVALRLAQICQAAEVGDPTALQLLARPSGSPLDSVTRLIVQQHERIQALESERRSGNSRPWTS